MNLAGLEAQFARHRTGFAAGGAVVVVVIALWRHHQAAQTPAATDASNADGTAATTSAADQGDSAYSSQPYDVYDSIESQLEALQQQLNEPAAPVTTTAPTPAPTKPAVPVYSALSPGWLIDFNHNGQVAPSPAAKTPAPVVRGTNL